MTECIIESGIPIPRDGRVKTGAAATMRALEIGQSFVMTESSYASIQRFITMKTGRKFTRRRIGDGNIRVWRIE